MKICFSCKRELEVDPRPGRGETCPFCGADLKVCLNCRFYDEGSYNSCREPQAERVLDKDRANYCEYFQFRESEGERAHGEDPLKRLEDLFKGS